MQDVEAALAAGYHVAGFVTYEAAAAFDTALATQSPSDLPLVWFGVFGAPLPAAGPAETRLAVADQAEWAPATTEARYREAVHAVREAIARGDTYQANYTFRLHARLDPASLEATYLQLVREQHPPYAAYLDVGQWRIVSLSPELFFRTEHGRLTTRPMKGTASRGRWVEDDAVQARALAASEKNRAENVMIVDLSRNDIGRIATIGSVHAVSLFDIERYPSVFQMVSTVEGQVAAHTTIADIFRAMFPAGSITGAPKTSSMRLIAAIEDAPRGVYCGAIGFAAPGGDACFNVAIRTAVVDRDTGRATSGAGGGITWDSNADAEYAEAVSKVSFLSPQPVFELFETMRWDGHAYIRLDRHLDRIRSSAEYFDFVWDSAQVAAELDSNAMRHGDRPRRVRLRLSREGAVAIDSDVLEPSSATSRPVVLADAPVDRHDRFLYHKTTRRDVFARARAHHPDAFDVLLWNQDGDLTEFTIGNLVVEIDGRRWTPPREAGLLAGVYRSVLIDAGHIQERRLAREDLRLATRVWLINSVREWVEVTLS